MTSGTNSSDEPELHYDKEIKDIPNAHLQAFLSLEKYFIDEYNVAIDKSCKNVNRLCFLSYDPAPTWKETSEVYDIILSEEKPEEALKKETTLPPVEKTEGETEKSEISDYVDIISQLEFYTKNIPMDEYNTWMKVGRIIFNETKGSTEGYKLFSSISSSGAGEQWKHYNTTPYEKIDIRALFNIWTPYNDIFKLKLKEECRKHIITDELYTKYVMRMKDEIGTYRVLSDHGGYHKVGKAEAITSIYKYYYNKGYDISDIKIDEEGHRKKVYPLCNDIHDNLLDISHKEDQLNFFDAGVIKMNNDRILIENSCKRISPLKGEHNEFDKYIKLAFGDKQGLYFLSWLSNSLKCFYNREATPGQVCIFAGPAGLGKSFLQQALLDPMFGNISQCDCWKYISGENQFSNNLNGCHWSVNDSIKESKFTDDLREVVSVNIKSISTERSFTQRNMYGPPYTLTNIFRRLTISLNDKQATNRYLPANTDDMKDKYHLFKFNNYDTSLVDFTHKMQDELPAIIYWLLNEYIIPDDIKETRFGIKAYHNEALQEDIADTTPELKMYRDFVGVSYGETSYTGKASDIKTELIKRLDRTDDYTQKKCAGEYRDMSNKQFSNYLVYIYDNCNKIISIKDCGKGHGNEYTIHFNEYSSEEEE